MKASLVQWQNGDCGQRLGDSHGEEVSLRYNLPSSRVCGAILCFKVAISRRITELPFKWLLTNNKAELGHGGRARAQGTLFEHMWS